MCKNVTMPDMGYDKKWRGWQLSCWGDKIFGVANIFKSSKNVFIGVVKIILRAANNIRRWQTILEAGDGKTVVGGRGRQKVTNTQASTTFSHSIHAWPLVTISTLPDIRRRNLKLLTDMHKYNFQRMKPKNRSCEISW